VLCCSGVAQPQSTEHWKDVRFTKLELKVGLLTKTWHHPESEKLFLEEVYAYSFMLPQVPTMSLGFRTCTRRLASIWADFTLGTQVDVGEESVRQVASGLRAHFTLETFCPGRKVVVVTNLKAAKMAGAESAGMVMACVHESGKVELVDPPADAKVGERIFIEGLSGAPATPTQVQKKKILPSVLQDLKTDAGCIATWQGKPLMTSAGPLKVCTSLDNAISHPYRRESRTETVQAAGLRDQSLPQVISNASSPIS
jgi:tRNA-binding EMAP/Myf-like protein